jgi:tRNA (adenine57-N1/adenine58-N1)-methyltransferase catalytic subunit
MNDSLDETTQPNVLAGSDIAISDHDVLGGGSDEFGTDVSAADASPTDDEVIVDREAGAARLDSPVSHLTKLGRNIFNSGERVLLIDSKQRRYLVTLKDGGEFHSHAGFVPHALLIGAPEGQRVRSTKGSVYTAIRPTLEDFVIEMPRGAQVIYPKDLAPICMLADIGPGCRVFESGVGSGALSMTMLRYGAEIVGYELREDFANRAVSNVRSFLGEAPLERYHVQIRDAYEGIDDDDFDRVVLDLPEPWNVVPHLPGRLRPGGIFLAYTPSITQAAQVREVLNTGAWINQRTLEVLHRGWHIEGQAVRPDHRMVAHTGFLTVGRYLG